MRRMPTLFAVVCVTMTAFAIPPTEAAAANLIVNPSNEEDLVGGEIPGWTEVVGSNWRKRTNNPPPFDGQAYFFAGPGSEAELAQVVDVSAFAASIDSGIQEFAFEGYVRTFPQSPSDLARIILEYRDLGDSILESFDSGEIANTTAWQLVADTRIAPVATRSINIRLISRRRAGTNNDGYFDALSLTPRAAIPEPSSFAMLSVGVIGLLGIQCRRRRG